MTNYEIMYIVSLNETEENIKALNDKIESFFKGHAQIENLGKKDLAYPIQKQTSGFYFVLNAKAKSESINEFNAFIKFNQNILRSLVINLDNDNKDKLMKKEDVIKSKRSKLAAKYEKIEKKEIDAKVSTKEAE